MANSRVKSREKLSIKEQKNYHDMVLLNILKYLVLLALTVLFVAVFMSLAKSNFNINQKEVVIMRHYGNMSFKEISEATNVSINTSLGRMRYAIINLRKMIEEKNLMLSAD